MSKYISAIGYRLSGIRYEPVTLPLSTFTDHKGDKADKGDFNTHSGYRIADSRCLIVMLVLGLFALPLHAISDNAGTKNGNFLKIATDARGVALGNSIVSMVKGADALRWNPAALGILEGKEVSATHVQYYQDVKIENIGAVYPLEEGGIGVSAFYLRPAVWMEETSKGYKQETSNFMISSAPWGSDEKMLTRAEGSDVSLGATVKVVQEKIAEQSFQNPAFDIGILASPKDDLDIGMAIRNLASGKANFAREFNGGVSYTIFHVFTGAFAVNYANDAPIRYSVGGEYKIPELESVIRAGYQTHDSLDSSIDSNIPALRGASLAGLTMGAGLGYKPPIWPNMHLDLDYAMAPFGALGISHTITVKAKW